MDPTKMIVRFETEPPELSKNLLPPTKIGRRIGNKLIPTESNGVYESQVLSRNHAELYVENGKVWLKDLESSNGTFVNGERISKPTELKEDSVVEFGVVVYDDDGETVKHNKVVATVHFLEQEAEILPDVVVRSLPPNVNLKSEETHELLLQSILSIIMEETRKQAEIDLTLQDLNELMDAGELQFKGPEVQVSSDTIKLQRELRVQKKKISDLEAQLEPLGQLKEESERLKKELEERQTGLIQAQKEKRLAQSTAQKLAEAEARLEQETKARQELESRCGELRKENELLQEGALQQQQPQQQQLAPEQQRVDPSEVERMEAQIAMLRKRVEELEAGKAKDDERMALMDYELEVLKARAGGASASPSSSSDSLVEDRRNSGPARANMSSKIRTIKMIFERGE